MLFIEYGFGGHYAASSGLYKLDVVDRVAVTYAVPMGQTYFTKAEIEQLVCNILAPRYRGIDYDLLTKNCNHFSNELALLLCGTSIPNWVNRPASLFSFFFPRNFFSPN